VNATDNIAIDTVFANITLPNSSNTLITLVNGVSSQYNSTYTIPDLLGQYDIEFVVNDTSGNVNRSVTTFFVSEDNTPPDVIDLKPTESSAYNVSDTITIAANVTDAIGIDIVFANITLPDSSIAIVTLIKGASNQYNNTYTIPNIQGVYNITIYANDTSENINNTEQTNFSVEDKVKPEVSDLRPLEGSGYNVSDSIEIAANVTDNAAVNVVLANITRPDGTTVTLTLSNVLGAKYNTSYTIPNIQGVYNITIIANDTDNNLNQSVKTNFSVEDKVIPEVIDLRPPESSAYNVSDAIEVSANVTDNAAVNVVLANITRPDGTTVTLTLTNVLGNKYNTSYTIPNVQGVYNITIIANDTDNNLNQSVRTNFSVEDKVIPEVNDIAPSAGSTYNISDIIEVKANATDNAAVDTVVANITLPNSSTILITLTSAIGNKYNNSYTIPDLLGQYNITFIANDTSNNINKSVTTFFVSEDNVPPDVTDLKPAGETYSTATTITVQANVSDAIGVHTVFANVMLYWPSRSGIV